MEEKKKKKKRKGKSCLSLVVTLPPAVTRYE